MQDVNLSLFICLYLIILFAHFSYAAWVISNNYFSLSIGLIKRPFDILSLLLLLNGISLSVFFVKDTRWILANILLHILLAADESLRMRKTLGRWPFLINHCLWSILLVFYLQ